jgi:hypothetical protein
MANFSCARDNCQNPSLAVNDMPATAAKKIMTRLLLTLFIQKEGSRKSKDNPV